MRALRFGTALTVAALVAAGCGGNSETSGAPEDFGPVIDDVQPAPTTAPPATTPPSTTTSSAAPEALAEVDESAETETAGLPPRETVEGIVISSELTVEDPGGGPVEYTLTQARHGASELDLYLDLGESYLSPSEVAVGRGYSVDEGLGILVFEASSEVAEVHLISSQGGVDVSGVNELGFAFTAVFSEDLDQLTAEVYDDAGSLIASCPLVEGLFWECSAPPATTASSTTTSSAPEALAEVDETADADLVAGLPPRQSAEGISVTSGLEVQDLGSGAKEYTLIEGQFNGRGPGLYLDLEEAFISPGELVDVRAWNLNVGIALVIFEASPEVAEVHLISTQGGTDVSAVSADGYAFAAVRGDDLDELSAEAYDAAGNLIATCQPDADNFFLGCS